MWSDAQPGLFYFDKPLEEETVCLARVDYISGIRTQNQNRYQPQSWDTGRFN
jgi:hypothetical protein